MIETLVQHGIQYGVYLAEVGLFLYLVLWGHCKRLAGVSLYVAGLLTIDTIARPRVLALYGFTSPQYFYFFYVTDAILALSAFLLVCSFFRRASVERREMWQSLRLVLVSVFIIVVGISCVSLKMNYTNLFGRFTTEFEQHLYFTCLVLNTVLYILIQHVQVADDELELLVCGMGIQFAGPAANFALMYLTPGSHFFMSVMQYVGPLCTLGMLGLCFYAVRIPKAARARAREARRLGNAAVRRA